MRTVESTDSPEEMQRAFKELGLEGEPFEPGTVDTEPKPEGDPTPEGTTAAEPAAAEPSTQESTEPTERDEKGRFTGKKGVQERIDELTAAKYQEKGRREAAEARIAALETRLEELSKPTAAKPADVPKPEEAKEPVLRAKPKVEDFPDYGEYLENLGQWFDEATDFKVQKATRGLEAKLEAARSELKQQTQQELVVAEKSAALLDRKAEFLERNPEINLDQLTEEFDRKVGGISQSVNDALAGYADDESGIHDIDLLAYLAQHPDEAKALNEQTLLDPKKVTPNDFRNADRVAARAIERIHQKLVASKGETKPPAAAPKPGAAAPPAIPTPKTPKPAPIEPPRGGSAASTVDPTTMTSAVEFREHLRTEQGKAWFKSQGGTDADLRAITGV